MDHERSARRRNILLVTTDQQRYDALGCNGGRVARTPVADGLAASGIRYTRAHPTSVVCMPSRASIVTGQSVSTHGVWMNGVALPVDAPSVVPLVNEAGYATGIFGKAHFEPYLGGLDQFYENRMAHLGQTGPYRGFDHLELGTHSPIPQHYGQWMLEHHPEHMGSFYAVLDADLQVNQATGGDTGAPQVAHNPVPTGIYHTDWFAERAMAWLDQQPADQPWLCWLSFPDPHHPWDPPAEELHRVDWRDLDLPEGYPADRAERESILDAKPAHWRQWYDGRRTFSYEAPPGWVPATLTPDQVREVNAMTHIENELIDEALGRVLARIDERGWGDHTDVIVTTDHGELQGDFGLLFKGPYHVDSLMRLPLIWRPAPTAGVGPAVVDAPVGLADLAATMCRIAGVEVPDTVETPALPASPAEAQAQGREAVVTEWYCEVDGVTTGLRSIFAGGWLATACLAGTVHDGTEGELYDTAADPHQRENRWDDPGARAVRDDLLAELAARLPSEPARHRLVASV